MTTATADDRQLLDAYVRGGDEAAFAELVRRHQAMMRSAAQRVCGDPEEAQDAMQRALIAFARRAGEIRADLGAGPWLHRAATLEAMALRRQRLKRRAREQDAVAQGRAEAGGMPPELAAELDVAIDRLAAKDRTAIVLHYFEGHSFRAIADKHGGTEMAWQKRGVRAVAKLAAILRRRGVAASATALGGLLAAGRAEAGALPAVLQESLRQPWSAAAPMQGHSLVLLIMKTKLTLALCFLGGAILSYAWTEGPARSGSLAAASSATAPQATRIERDDRREVLVFNLDGLAAAIRRFDALDEDDPSRESQLRALMFSLPADYLAAVRELLGGVRRTERFQAIAASFYARWAELDPEAAWLAAGEEEIFKKAARRGVLLTWLNVAPDVALERLLEAPQDGDLAILQEFIGGKSQHAPRDAARLVDRLTGSWPEADRRLFPQVARAWALKDPAATGDWVASYGDRGVRNQLLRELSQNVARSMGRPGIALADRIDDPPMRTAARLNAARWWGISNGAPALSGKTRNPDVWLDGRFPGDWSIDEIRAFSLGTMANFAKYYPELIAIARGGAQQQAVYEGVIGGASFSQPALVADAVENVDPAFAATASGRKSLTAFILRWTETEPAAAGEWLAAQPANAKTALMREALNR
ncbi:sigma-70 family RNA polymerase sigma factor [Luteolibacter marinus]|uniref:sigma-70 family RNA polymerase sigma factor n=1 Tax=Luteolibacter marinus TaxID=2776705 RepID=UPI001865E0FA|nr:sigma-70 family RNA polymerase sigma factor [Luteolibacter marinus]